MREKEPQRDLEPAEGGIKEWSGCSSPDFLLQLLLELLRTNSSERVLKSDIVYGCVELNISFEDEKLYVKYIADTTHYQPQCPQPALQEYSQRDSEAYPSRPNTPLLHPIIVSSIPTTPPIAPTLQLPPNNPL